jgi:hypothetical protein
LQSSIISKTVLQGKNLLLLREDGIGIDWSSQTEVGILQIERSKHPRDSEFHINILDLFDIRLSPNLVFQQKNDTIFYEGRATSHGVNRELLDVSTPADESTENELLLIDAETSTAPHKSMPLSDKLKLAVLAILGCCIPLIWALNGCMSADNVQGDEISSTTFDLVKYTAPAPSASASAPAVLEGFQVYQPVLTHQEQQMRLFWAMARRIRRQLLKQRLVAAVRSS